MQETIELSDDKKREIWIAIILLEDEHAKWIEDNLFNSDGKQKPKSEWPERPEYLEKQEKSIAEKFGISIEQVAIIKLQGSKEQWPMPELQPVKKQKPKSEQKLLAKKRKLFDQIRELRNQMISDEQISNRLVIPISSINKILEEGKKMVGIHCQKKHHGSLMFVV